MASKIEALAECFGDGADFAQLVKHYAAEHSVEAKRRYSPPHVVRIDQWNICGVPDRRYVSTSVPYLSGSALAAWTTALARANVLPLPKPVFRAAMSRVFVPFNCGHLSTFPCPGLPLRSPSSALTASALRVALTIAAAFWYYNAPCEATYLMKMA